MQHEILARRLALELGLGAVDIERLGGGGGNTSLRLRGAHDDVVVRLAGASSELGANRESERVIAMAAAAAGLAPEVLLSRPAQGLLVTRHVLADVLPPSHWALPETVARMGDWFARLHRLPLQAEMAAVDLAGRASDVLQFLPAAEAATLADKLVDARARMPTASCRVPCHHDLHAGNLCAVEGRILAIDWEYAGAGDPAADLAGYACYHDLEDEATAALISAYGNAGGQTATESVGPMRWIFDCLCYGWAAQAMAQGLDPVVDVNRLRARLAS